MVVVGAGECGARAALALRENGWQGPITLIGDEAVDAYERPPLSKTFLQSKAAPELVHPFAAQTFADSEIDVRRSTQVVAVEPGKHRVVLADGEGIDYEKLLLAVGAQARRLPGDQGEGVYYLRTHADAMAIRPLLSDGRHLGILGAGFIGLEIAASARARGCNVTVIEFTDRALARAVPAEVAAEVVAEHRSRGVEFVWGEAVVETRPAGGGTRVRLTHGAVRHFDALVVGIGAAPAVELAVAAGIEVENGIRLDDRLRSSSPDVFAAGDCASFPHPLFSSTRIRLESWRSAHDQAATVARNMMGGDLAHTAVPWFWSDQYDASLQIAGLPHLARRHAVRRRPDGVEVHFGLDHTDQMVSVSAFGPGNAVAKDIRLAEMMLQRGARPDPGQLTDPGVNLKSLLAAHAS